MNIRRALTILLTVASALLGAQSAYAAHGKVILLTSVDGVETARATPAALFWVRSKYYKLNARLESDFRKHFEGSGLEVEVFHYADLSLMYQVLHSPEYVGVYWVSHGADAAGDSPVASGGIFDYQIFDISPLLKDVHPGLRLLSIVSCHSTGILEQLKAQGQLARNNPDLKILSYRDKVDAEQGLQGVLSKGDEVLRSSKPSDGCMAERSGIPVSLTRTCRQKGPALFLKSNDRILAVLPSCEAGETQPISGYIDLSEDDLSDLEQGQLDPSVLDISLSTGAQPVDRVMAAPAPYFGEISIKRLGLDDRDPAWKLLEMGHDRALGVNHRIFAYQGAAPAPQSVRSYHPFRCQ